MDVENEREKALKDSSGSFVFNPDNVTAYYVNFKRPVKLILVRVQVRDMISVRDLKMSAENNHMHHTC